MITPILIVSMNLAVFLVFYLYIKRRLDRALKSDEMANRARTEINQMILELNQITDRNISLIEDRLNALTEILSKADKSIVLMNREVEKQDSRTGVYSHLKPRSLPANQAALKTESTGTAKEKVLELHRQDVPAGSIAKMLNITVAEAEFIISLGDKKA